jgi:hypothetical protein
MNDIFQGGFQIEDLVLDLSLELPMMRRSVSSSTLLSSRLERRATTMHTTPTKLQVVEKFHVFQRHSISKPPQHKRNRSSSMDSSSQSKLGFFTNRPLTAHESSPYHDPCQTAYKNYQKSISGLTILRTFMSRSIHRSQEPPQWSLEIDKDSPKGLANAMFRLNRLKTLLVPTSLANMGVLEEDETPLLKSVKDFVHSSSSSTSISSALSLDEPIRSNNTFEVGIYARPFVFARLGVQDHSSVKSLHKLKSMMTVFTKSPKERNLPRVPFDE